MTVSALQTTEPSDTGFLTPHDFFRCLADPLRLQAVLLIDQCGELCVCELVEALSEPQPKVSRHLAQLRGCGLLRDSRRGHWVFYALHPELPAWALQTLQALAQAQSLSAAKQRLQCMSDRPARCGPSFSR